MWLSRKCDANLENRTARVFGCCCVRFDALDKDTQGIAMC